MSDAAAGGVILLKDSKTPVKISVEHAQQNVAFRHNVITHPGG